MAYRVALLAAAVSWAALAEPSYEGPPIVPHSGLAEGDWPDRLQLDVPPGPAQFGPTIAITANHQSRDGVLGMGFQLEAGGIIERRSPTGGVPTATLTGATYLLDGKRLIFLIARATTGEPNSAVQIYGTEVDTGASVAYEERTNSWTVSKDGWTYQYGSTTGTGLKATKMGVPHVSVPTAPADTTTPTSPTTTGRVASGCPRCDTFAWYLSKATDPWGNTLLYDYRVDPVPTPVAGIYTQSDSRNHLNSVIRWTSASGTLLGKVVFEYAARPDLQIDYASGTSTVLGHRLTGVRIYKGESTAYARYTLEYLDQNGRDCDGNPMALTDPSDLRNLIGQGPLRSLLRRINRVDVDDASRLRVMRCVQTNHERITSHSWASPVRLPTILAPNGAFEIGAKVIPIPANINGDGRSDLVVLTLNRGVADHHVYLSRVGGADLMVLATSQDLGGGSYQTQIRNALTPSHLDGKRGWFLGDFDRDGYPDMVYEVDTSTVGSVQMARFQPTLDYFEFTLPKLNACRLRASTTVDIDGDGFLDLVRRPNAETDGCEASTETKWLRNLGKAPWFDEGVRGTEWQPLQVPLADPKAAGFSVVLPDLLKSWTLEEYVSNQSRFGDFNGDGIADIAYAFRRSWGTSGTETPCPPGKLCLPLEQVPYSRIFFGTGRGTFEDSRLGAGGPLLTFTGPTDAPTAYYTGLLESQDMDRSGHAELVSTVQKNGYPSAILSHWRGIAHGFLGPDSTIPFTGQGSAVLEETSLGLEDYPDNGSDCHNRGYWPAYADFDGDGFTDIIGLSWFPDRHAASLPCGTNEWCANYRLSTRATVEGRVSKSDGPWGGRTLLTWAFSGDVTLNGFNADLPFSSEVLTKVDGADGAVDLRYARGTQLGGAAKGFGLVERTNARGGVDVFVQATTPPLAGRAAYFARYRNAGGLEKVTVFVHGHLSADGKGYRIDVKPPYFNPLIRRCEYEVERVGAGTSQPTLNALIASCWGFGGRRVPSTEHLWAILGLDRYPAPGGVADAAAIMWTEKTSASEWLELDDTTGPGMVSNLWGIYFVASFRSIPWRWEPSDLALPAAPSVETFLADVPPQALGRNYKEYVTDFVFADANVPRATQMWRHRDTSLREDDLKVDYEWQVAGSGYRMVKSTTRGEGAITYATTTRSDFVGFDVARNEQTCGEGGKGCRTELTTYDSDGSILTRDLTESGEKETWTRTGWCAQETYQDAAGQKSESVFDSRCRRTQHTWRGVVRTSSYDGFNRQVTASTVINGGPPSSSQITYDDDFEKREDKKYAEPRTGVVRDGTVELEYRDGFGRLTRRVTCEKNGAGGTMPRCKAGTEVVQEWNLYGTDGLARATAAPFILATEAPVFSVIAHSDGLGRALLTQRPAPVDKSKPAWVNESAWWAPGRTLTRDAVGRLRIDTSTTLSEETELAGKRFSRVDYDAFSRAIRTDDAENGEAKYIYDAEHRLAAISREAKAESVDAKGAIASQSFKRSVEYDRYGYQRRILEPDGTSTEMENDVLGRPLRQTLRGADGTTTVLARWSYTTQPDSTLRVVTTDENGAITEDVLDGLDRKVARKTPDGVSWTRTYDPAKRQVREVKDDGALKLTTVYENDVHGHLKTVTTPRGRVSLTTDGAGRTSSFTGLDGAVRRNSFLFAGVLHETRLTATKGGWLLYRASYANDLRPIQEWSDGVVTDLQYDAFGRLTTKTTGGTAKLMELVYAYQGLSDRVESVTRTSPGFGAAVTRFTYDPWGRMTSQSHPEPGKVTYAYDVMGRLRFVTDEVGTRQETQYDARGRLVRGDIPGWGPVSVSYTPGDTYVHQHDKQRTVGQLLRVDQISASGARRSTWTDSAGRTIASRAADGRVVEQIFQGDRLIHRYEVPSDGGTALHTLTEYDGMGDVTGLYGPELHTAQPFDAKRFKGYRILLRRGVGGRVESIDAAGERSVFAYDPKSGLPTEERYRGLVRRVQYEDPLQPDAFLRIRSEELVGKSGLVRRSTFTFNANGQLTLEEVDDPNGLLVKRWERFDPWGLPTFDERARGPTKGPVVPEVAQHWTRDLRGQPIRRELVVEGKTAGITAWTWRANGQLASEAGPGGRPLTYDYDNSRMAKVRTADDRVIQAEVKARDGAFRPTRIELAGGSRVEIDWTTDGRLRERRQVTANGQVSSRWTPKYDGFGRISVESIASGSRSWSNSYQYDAVSRLTGETRGQSGAPIEYTYQLNSAGGRTRTLRGGVQTTALNYDSAFPVERVTAVNSVSLLHDDWDDVLKDQHGIEYGYAADGSLVTAKRVGAPTYRILRDAGGLPIASQENQDALRLTTWHFDAGRAPLQVQMPDGRTLTYVAMDGMLLRHLEGTRPTDYFTNWSGTPLSIGGVDSADLTAFGEGTSSSKVESLLWAGMETLPGLPEVRLARHRIYDPATGRFLRPDPIGLDGGLHRTLYADGDPVSRTDALGLWACPSTPTTPEKPINLSPPSSNHFNVPPPSFGSGNASHDAMMIQLGAGLSAKEAPSAQFELGVKNPFISETPCAFICSPPGDETSGGSSGGTAFPMAPAPTAAKGSGPSRFERKWARWSETRRGKWMNKQLARAKREEIRQLKKDPSFNLAAIGQGIIDNPFDFSKLAAFIRGALNCKGFCEGKKLHAFNFLMGALLPDPPDDFTDDPPPPPPPEPPPAPVKDFKPDHWGWYLPSQNAVVVYGVDLKVPLWVPVPPPAPPKVKPPPPPPVCPPTKMTYEPPKVVEPEPEKKWIEQIEAKIKMGGCTGMEKPGAECSLSIISVGNEFIGVSVDLEIDETGAWFVISGTAILGGEVRVPAKMCKDCNDPFFPQPGEKDEDVYEEIWKQIQEENTEEGGESGNGGWGPPGDTGESPPR